MNQLTEYFSPTKLAELKTRAAPVMDEFNFVTRHGSRIAKQELEVYDKREQLAQLAAMIEDLKGVMSKVEEIQKFAEDNGLEDMVSFCCWSNAEYEIDNVINSDVESDAMGWMRSNHDC